MGARHFKPLDILAVCLKKAESLGQKKGERKFFPIPFQEINDQLRGRKIAETAVRRHIRDYADQGLVLLTESSRPMFIALESNAWDNIEKAVKDKTNEVDKATKIFPWLQERFLGAKTTPIETPPQPPKRERKKPEQVVHLRSPIIATKIEKPQDQKSQQTSPAVQHIELTLKIEFPNIRKYAKPLLEALRPVAALGLGQLMEMLEQEKKKESSSG